MHVLMDALCPGVVAGLDTGQAIGPGAGQETSGSASRLYQTRRP